MILNMGEFEYSQGKITVKISLGVCLEVHRHLFLVSLFDSLFLMLVLFRLYVFIHLIFET